MVQLLGMGDAWIMKHIGNFNSTMVQLLAYFSVVTLRSKIYFNSTMVQLLEHKPLLYQMETTISIPLWFNY